MFKIIKINIKFKSKTFTSLNKITINNIKEFKIHKKQ